VQQTAAGAPPIGVRTLIAELTELPPNPSVALRVLQVIDDPEIDAAHLGRLVETDPALAAHTLRLANAPIHEMVERITSARRAVIALGFELVRSLAALTAGGVLGGGRRAAPAGFWQHSLGVAAASMVIARHLGRSEGEACSVGLLHDLGAALQYRAAPELYDAMVVETAGNPIARSEAERRIFEVDHAEAGAAVLAAWGFPDPIVEVLRDHHRNPGPYTGELVLIVRAAEALAQRIAEVPNGEPVIDAAEALVAVGVAVDLDTLLAEVREQTTVLQGVLS
jgi:putative nucleotidyltransferase with HDIG domain